MNSAFHHGIVGALAILIMFCLYYGGKVLRQIIKDPRAVNRFLPKRHLGAKQTAIDSISGTVSSSKNNISELKQALIVIVLFGAIAGIEYLVNDYATIINVLIDPYFYSPYLFMGFALFLGLSYPLPEESAKTFLDALWRVLGIIGCVLYFIIYTTSCDDGFFDCLGVYLAAFTLFLISRYIVRRIKQPNSLYKKVFLVCSGAFLISTLIIQFVEMD